MSDKRAPRRSLDDWMKLVTECRQNGLTDAAMQEIQNEGFTEKECVAIEQGAWMQE